MRGLFLKHQHPLRETTASAPGGTRGCKGFEAQECRLNGLLFYTFRMIMSGLRSPEFQGLQHRRSAGKAQEKDTAVYHLLTTTSHDAAQQMEQWEHPKHLRPTLRHDP